MDQKSPFYITCAIPYTNAPAHIGHALEFVQSDVLARYHRDLGEDVLLSHGADEHGSKNYKTALELGIDPQAFADDITPKFIKIHEALNISYDRFVRTTSSEHKKSAQALWKKLEASGDIYKSKYEGLYCVGCETFVTDGQARENKGICPIHEKPYEKLVEENYFFRLSKYLTEIEEAIKTDRIRIVPVTRKHEALALIGEGLSDLSASRPVASLPWGVPVPSDKDQVMYVWFEALMYYLTALSYPGGDVEHYWPAQIQVIGKDILRFHALIWPAILLSAGLDLPKALSVHGFVSSAGKKMSKSLGNTIDPFEAVEQYGADAFRYYLLRHIPAHDDGDFTWEKFEQSYNSELADDLGNLVFRTASMVSRYQDGAIGQVPEAEHDVSRYHEALENFQFDRALETVWEQIHSLNQYIEEEKPWELAKEDKDHLSEVLGYLVGSLLQIAQLLDPFLPATAQQIREGFKDGVISPELKPLFPKIYKYTPDPKTA
jgi:methionyl-tRNA synthetase